MTGHYTVLGAGIVGVCCALYLQGRGYGVTLIDRDDPGRGCSYGNAGMIQTGSCVPLATPGVLREVPRMLLDPKSPLVIRWRYLPELAPWLMRLVNAARPSRVEEISLAPSALLGQAKDAYRPLWKAAAAEDLVRDRGELYVYRSAKAYAAARAKFDTSRRHGTDVVELTGGALRQLEPALSRDYEHGYYLPGSMYTVDPLRLTQRLVAAFAGNGGTVVRREIHDIEVRADGGLALVTTDRSDVVEGLVVAAGAYSRGFAAKLGRDVPLESERGYHLMLPHTGVRLQGPVIDGDRHLAAIPMLDGIRLAGTIELAGLDAPPNDARADMLLPMAQELIPGLPTTASTRWMGHRPGMPDSLPVIDRAPAHPNAYFAFGHGTLGLTLAAITGQLIADLASGQTSEFDLRPYRADRF